MVRKATEAELRAARADPRQLHMLPLVSPDELAAMRTTAAIAFDLVDRAVALGRDPVDNYAEFHRTYRMVMELIERLEQVP